MRAYSPVFTTLLRYPIDKLAAVELVAITAEVTQFTIAFVCALTTIGNVVGVPVINVDGVVAVIPVHPVRIIRVQLGIDSVVTTEGVDLVIFVALVECLGVLGTRDIGRISRNGE